MKIVIAGATGFIGRRLIHKLKYEHEITALTRSPSKSADPQVKWLKCDLFNYKDIDKALKGADIAIFLVHSMLPTARLNQASFEDMDLLLASHFARSAERNKVKRIVYLGGLIPEDKKLSAHLRSRLEVEEVFLKSKVDTIALRAGLVMGEEGSSFQMLYWLVKRLPMMICPTWTLSETQPVDIDTVVEAIAHSAQNFEIKKGNYDLGSPTTITYQGLMIETAKQMGLKRPMISVPLFSPGLSNLWVSLITGASSHLVAPLVQSLRYPMVARKDYLFPIALPSKSISDSIADSIKSIQPVLRQQTRDRVKAQKRRENVISIQRITHAKLTATQISTTYWNWLKQKLGWLIEVKSSPSQGITLKLKPVNLKLLSFEANSSHDETLCTHHIADGLLISKKSPTTARIEFLRTTHNDYGLIAVQDFLPRLPWPIYLLSQAWIHLWVTRAFIKSL
ncbi:MAG: NAD(P)H-binding protein [Xanthomonadaceae bacterium]|nr:NAD(P)H-binding protein [Xanthomonadaceae bacterium]